MAWDRRFDKTIQDLEDEMLKLNLISQAGLSSSGPKKTMKGKETKPKPRKRVKRKFQRITNLHLEGTELAQQLEDESYL